MSRVSKQTLIDRSNKNMASGTHPVIRESAIELISRAYDEGINVQISEGHRSYERQNELYAQGRTKPGNIVTNARGGYSWHNFGIALDFFLTNHDGSKAIWNVDSKWRRVAQIGKSLGFEWGGDWTSFRDYPHLQMRGGLTMAQMRGGAKPKLASRVKNPIKPSTPSTPSTPSKPSVSKWTKVSGNWTGQTLREGQHGTPVLQMQQMLASVYFFPEKGAKLDGIDGYFGANTTDAVRRYQGIQGLKVDGIPGKEVYHSLKGTKPSDKKEGWIKNKTGWWYQNKDGSYPKDKWQKINKQWYLFNKSGYMLTGWQKVKDIWYYMNASGHMQTGWTKVKDSWYYMNSSGHMQTGWVKLSNKWYYMNSSGRMEAGLIKVKGKDYYLQRDGVLITDDIIKLEADKSGSLK